MAEEAPKQEEVKEEPKAEVQQGEYSAPEVPEEEVQQEPADEQTEQESDPWESVLSQAERYGFSADEAKSYSTPEIFEQALIALDKQAAKFGREQLKAWEEQAKQSQEEPAEKKEPAKKGEAKKSDYKKYEITLDPNEYEEETLKTLNGINDHYDSVVREQQDKIQMMEQVLIAMGERFLQNSDQTKVDESQKFETEMDAFFDGLGDEFKPVFGKGAARLLSPSSKELISRNELLEEMKVLSIADDQANRPRQSYKELAQRAVRSLHYDKLKTSVRKELVDKGKERQSQHLARPSGSNSKGPTKRETALKRVEDFYREKGFRLADWDDEEIEV